MSLMQRGAADLSAAQDAEPRQRSATVRRMLGGLGILVFILFTVLGTWQVKRLFWKLDLIARVEQRVHAAPAAAPGPALWPQVSAAGDEYRHVSVSGVFLYDMTTRVQASTELGGGFWLLTPLCAADGSIVLINRGFVAGAIGKPAETAAAPTVPPAQACAAARAAAASTLGAAADGAVATSPAAVTTAGIATAGNATTANAVAGAASTVTGLLRISEPSGAFLRNNDPAGNRWFSRDVAAIAAVHGLPNVAPYFIDADADTARQAVSASPDEATAVDSAGNDAAVEVPVGGLTVISFHNNHLVYAFTWYVLALMVASALYWVAREERKLRRRTAAASAVPVAAADHGG